MRHSESLKPYYRSEEIDTDFLLQHRSEGVQERGLEQKGRPYTGRGHQLVSCEALACFWQDHLNNRGVTFPSPFRCHLRLVPPGWFGYLLCAPPCHHTVYASLFIGVLSLERDFLEPKLCLISSPRVPSTGSAPRWAFRN